MDGSLVFASLRQCESTAQTASLSIQPFLHSSRQSPYTLQWVTPFPFKIGPYTPYKLGANFEGKGGVVVPQPTRVHNSNGISIGSTVLHGS